MFLERGVRRGDQGRIAVATDQVIALAVAREGPSFEHGRRHDARDTSGSDGQAHVAAHDGLVEGFDLREPDQLARLDLHASDAMALRAGTEEDDVVLFAQTCTVATAVADLAGRQPQVLARGAVVGAQLSRNDVVHPLPACRRVVAVDEHGPFGGEGDPVDLPLELGAPAALGGRGHGPEMVAALSPRSSKGAREKGRAGRFGTAPTSGSRGLVAGQNLLGDVLRYRAVLLELHRVRAATLGRAA